MKGLTFAKVFTKMARKRHDLGQSLRLDSITRDLLNDGTLRRYVEKVRAV